MRAGPRNRRVKLLAETKVDDGRGGQTVSWTPIAQATEVWASHSALSAREFLQAGAVQNIGSCLFEMDRRTGVTIKHRIYWPLRDKTFEIVSERDSDVDYGVELECNEVDS
jgi:SPP1 family predicted phage head-tail adaptor